MKHCIIVKYNEKVTDKKELLKDIKDLFLGVINIEGIHAVAFRESVIDRPNRYDLMIEIDMEKEALGQFDESQVHIDWKKNFGGYLETKAIFDYDK